MTYNEVLEQARGCIGKYCKACPVCNGKACSNQIPGPGAKGSGDNAIRNFDKWQSVRLNMDTICENVAPDTTIELFGKKFKYPFFAAPVGAVNLHYGDKYNDMEYNNVLVASCAEAGIAAFTGDGTDSQVMEYATNAIKKAGGTGVPTIKPWNMDIIKAKLALAKDSGAFAVAMDNIRVSTNFINCHKSIFFRFRREAKENKRKIINTRFICTRKDFKPFINVNAFINQVHNTFRA